MNYLEFSKQIKEKYPDYKDVDDVVLVRKMLAKYPEYNDRVDTTNIGIKPEQSVQQPVQEKPKTAGEQLLNFGNKVATAVSPRAMKMSNIDNVSDFGRGLLSTGLDIASLGPRAAVSTLATPLDLIKDTYENGLGSAILNQPSRFIENLGVTETPKGSGIAGVVEDVARGPFVPVPGVGSFVPKTASFVPKLASGLGDIALGAGMGTAESVAKGKGVNPFGATLGGALGALSPLGRAFKYGSDKFSDKSFVDDYTKQMQDLYLKAKASKDDNLANFAEKFLNEITHAKDPASVVRSHIDNGLIMSDILGDYAKDANFTKVYNSTREALKKAGKSDNEANLGAMDAAREASSNYNPMTPTTIPQLDPNKTIAQGVRDVTRWEKPNLPGPGSDNRFLAGAQKSSDIRGIPGFGAWASLFTGAGAPYFLYDLARKNPHELADATRVIPKETGTVIRNLGATLMDKSESKNRKYNQK